jgi:hypothetical protein
MEVVSARTAFLPGCLAGNATSCQDSPVSDFGTAALPARRSIGSLFPAKRCGRFSGARGGTKAGFLERVRDPYVAVLEKD